MTAYQQGQLRFQEGVESFLNLLDTEKRLLEDQRQYAQSVTETAASLVAVYKALGGGWEVFENAEDPQKPVERLFTP
jgi:multidrug efflux system outer membrane protein